MPDWTLLNEKLRDLRTRQVVTDPQKQIFEVVFTGLETKLSEVMEGAPEGGATSVTVFADTLTIDRPSFAARGSVFMVRSLDLTPLGGGIVTVPVPKSDVTVVEIMGQQSLGASLQLNPSSGGTTPYTVVLGDSPLQAVFYIVDTAGKVTTDVRRAPADIQDLAGQPWALNTLRSSYGAATYLASSDSPSDNKVAQQMLSWVIACIRVLGEGGGKIPSDYLELYNQSAAVLVSLNVAPGAFFVPILSADFYKQQAMLLIDALESYEKDMNVLTTTTDIQKALATVSETLKGVSQDEIQPLQVQLEQIRNNITALETSIRQLQEQYIVQAQDASSRFAVMQAAIISEKAARFFKAALELTIAPYKIAMNVALLEEDPTKILEIVETIKKSVETSIEAINDVSTDPPGDPALLDNARALLRMQQQLMISYGAGAMMWGNARNDEPTTNLPPELGVMSIDPSLAWENFWALAKADVNTARSGMEDPATADRYLASLEILVNYGKAIAAKFVALGGQYANGTVVKAQIAAAKNTMERWRQLEAQSKTEQEKLAAMKGLVQSRMDSIKRSIFSAWLYYRNSYFYLYFQKPPYVIDLSMNAARMRDVFARVSEWIGRLLGDSGGDPIRLPQQNVNIQFEFDIIRADGPQSSSINVALYSPASAAQRARLTWAIPIGTDQLKGVLPDGGAVAIWITRAEFFIEGIQPNQRGNVIINVAASGAYRNGFGPAEAFNFVTKAMSGDFAYHLPDGVVYTPWTIDVGVYMTPTPFTQWTMLFDPDGGDPSAATKLRMKLTVAYRRR